MRLLMEHPYLGVWLGPQTPMQQQENDKRWELPLQVPGGFEALIPAQEGSHIGVTDEELEK